MLFIDLCIYMIFNILIMPNNDFTLRVLISFVIFIITSKSTIIIRRLLALQGFKYKEQGEYCIKRT